jgi:hypothetical protein
MSYITLKGRCTECACPNDEAKDDNVKDSFYEELEQVFDQFPRYHIKILLGDFNAKVGRENIFKPIIGNGVYMEPVMITES